VESVEETLEILSIRPYAKGELRKFGGDLPSIQKVYANTIEGLLAVAGKTPLIFGGFLPGNPRENQPIGKGNPQGQPSSF